MTSTLQPAIELGSPVALDSASEVLEFVRAEQVGIRLAEARVFAAAVTWAHQHPPESVVEASGWEGDSSRGCEQLVPIAGEGAPLVAEFCIAELAAALGMSSAAGKSYLGQALEVHHRLPAIAAMVEAGDLPVWRAGRIAERTISLCPDGAAYVDSRVAPVADKAGLVTLDRLVTEALARFEPERAAEEAARAAEDRHLRIGHVRPDQPGALSATSFITGAVDVADALDLEAAIQVVAAQLAEQGDTDSLDVRRAKAVGIIARDYTTPAPDKTPEPGRATTPPAQGPRVVLHVHLSEAAVRGCTCTLQLARLEDGAQIVHADQVRAWCRAALDAGQQIIVKPVIDLADHVHVGAYEIPDRLSEQTDLRDHHCVFPWCTRPARRCDHDHVVPHDRGGPTCTCNTAPLCRRHHRLKTHAAWSYVPLEPGSYVWTSPHGYQYLVDHTGTLDVTQAERRGRPLPPHARQP